MPRGEKNVAVDPVPSLLPRTDPARVDTVADEIEMCRMRRLK